MPKAALQGTDGVRGLVVDECHPRAVGADARAAFAESGVLTPGFIAHYVFEAGVWLLERASERLISPTAIVLAWDPRDESGELSAACADALARAGAHALVAGVLPTPAAAVYLAGVGGAGAAALTASHNPADQNGVKIFLSPDSAKPLPEEDAALSARVWAGGWPPAGSVRAGGRRVEAAAEARAFYSDYLSRLPNCWLREGALAGWDVVIDAAGGAWSGLAAQIVEGFSPRSVREANPLGRGRVNEGGGVVALEGRRAVRGTDERFLEAHAGARALLGAGRARRGALRRGEGLAAACVFDADGDRSCALVYDPFGDALRVLDGDDALVLQAGLLEREGELPEGGAAVLTIESDSGAASALARMGLRVVFTPVGDKWILREARRLGESFVMGGEESGHTVVPGLLANAAGEGRRIAVGDGLKSFLNTCAAARALLEDMAPEAAHAVLATPFPRGFKESRYAYHVDGRRLAPGGAAREAVAGRLMASAEAAFEGAAAPRWAPLEDDPGVLRLVLEDAAGAPLGAIYARNSGTESRTGVVLRGPAAWAERLSAVGEEVLREILARVKDAASPGARAERRLLEALGEGGMDAAEVDALLEAGAFGAPVRPADVCREALRGGLARMEGDGLRVTPLGAWHLGRGE